MSAQPALAEIDVPDSAAPYFQDPAFQHAFEAEQQRLKDLWKQRTSPEGQQALEDSASAYADLSTSEAIELATDDRSGTLAEPSFDPLAGIPASDLDGFAGDYGAIVDVAGEPSNALVESTLPLQAETPSGELEPVDNQLEDHGQTLRPHNPLAELRLPQELSPQAEIELPDVDVSVAPEGVSQSPDAHVVAQRSFYASTWESTDFVVGPVGGGFESFFVLRAAASPESFGLGFDLPTGAELVAQGRGAAIVRDGEVLAEIAPPAASDADGVAVPVSYSVEGDTLVTRVSHRAGDWKFPITVDPTLTESYSTPSDFSEWTYSENDPDYIEYRQPTSGGLYVLGGTPWNPWANYGYLAFGSWAFNAPGTQSRIYKATFSSLYAASPLGGPYSQPFHWIMEGMVNASSQWENGITSAYGAASPIVFGGSGPNNWSTDHCLDAQAPYCRDFAGTNDNSAVLMSFANPGGYAETYQPYYGGFYTFMGSASVSIADTINPTMGTLTHAYTDSTGTHQGLPSGWVGGDVALTLQSQAQDLGLGIKTFMLNVPGLPLQTRTVTCAGDHSDRCPNTGMYSSHTTQTQNPDDYTTGDSFNYSTTDAPAGQPKIPEGDNTLKASATDALSNTSPDTPSSQWHLKVDRSAPEVTISGPLADASGPNKPLLEEETYRLDIDAADGVPGGSNAQKRSGVKSVNVFVDGELAYSFPPQSCPQGSCGFEDEWTFHTGEYAFGQHTVSVVANDQLDHASDPNQASLTFTTGSTDDDPPLVTIEAGPPDAQGNYQLDVEATDQGGSGVTHMEVYVDDTLVQSFDQECPNGGCPMSPPPLQMSGSQSPDDHEIIVFADDRVGNGETDSIGRVVSRFEFEGYNDDFTANLVNEANAGNADIIRMPIDWCSIQRFHQGDPPEQWDWQTYDDTFAAIRAINVGVTDPMAASVRVLAVAQDSPPFANSAGDPCIQKPVTPPDPDFEDEWRTFVGAFMARYAVDPTNGLVALEAWNEPNLPGFWGSPNPQGFVPEPGRFAHLVNIASAAASSFNILTIPGGLSPRPTGQNEWHPLTYAPNFIRAAYASPDTGDPEKIRATAVETTSIHLYAGAVRKDSNALDEMRNQLAAVRAGLNDTGYGFIPQWITEIGVPSTPVPHVSAPNSSEQRQCFRLKRAYFSFGNDNLLTAFIVHRLQDQTGGQEPQDYGVIDKNGERKRAFKWLRVRFGAGRGGPECRPPS